MRHTSKYILIAAGLIGLSSLSSCRKDFLDSTSSDVYSFDDINKADRRNGGWNDAIIPGFLNGISNILYASLQKSSSDHTDFSWKSFDIVQDLYSGDMELTQANYGHFEADALRQSYRRDKTRNYYVWSETYLAIQGANQLLDALGSGDQQPPQFTAEEEKDQEKKAAKMTTQVQWAQAIALRAANYMKQLSFYAPLYSSVDPEKTLVLPFYHSGLKAGATEPKLSLKAFYDTLIKDLQNSYQVLKANQAAIDRAGKKEAIDLDIVRGLLGRAYLSRGLKSGTDSDFAKALMYAKEVINGKQYQLLTTDKLTTDGFNSFNNTEFMWAVDITKETTGRLVSFFGQMDIFTYSYQYAGDQKVINAFLYNEAVTQHPNDHRIDWFHASMGIPWKKFFSTKGYQEYLNGKGIGQDKDWESDIVYMRLAEMYLIASEAAARDGNEAEAKRILLELLQNRIKNRAPEVKPTADNPNPPARKTDAEVFAEETTRINALSGTALLDEIYYNWRMEMWGEGFSLDVLKRFHKTSRRSPRSGYLSGTETPYTDPSLYFQIPDMEQNNNQKFKLPTTPPASSGRNFSPAK